MYVSLVLKGNDKKKSGNQLSLEKKKTTPLFSFVQFFQALVFFCCAEFDTSLYFFLLTVPPLFAYPVGFFGVFFFPLLFNHWPQWRFGATPSGFLCAVFVRAVFVVGTVTVYRGVSFGRVN